jgi:hypothetical protein
MWAKTLKNMGNVGKSVGNMGKKSSAASQKTHCGH